MQPPRTFGSPSYDGRNYNWLLQCRCHFEHTLWYYHKVSANFLAGWR